MADVNDNRTSLQKGIAYATDATTKDNAKEYSEALKSYELAIQYLIHASKYDSPDPKMKAAIRTKCAGYLTRAEKIKHLLSSKNSKKHDSGGTKTKKAEAKDDSDKEDGEGEKFRSALSGAVVVKKPNVSWEDVIGLALAKEALKEAVILPVKFPHLFTGKRVPWKGLLLYGPPGTGKSFLAQAVATEANESTFYSLSSSTLVSKWLGESEKLVKTLFEMARDNKPSIVFIDEVDSLFGARNDNESEAARRIKTEFLIQLDGVGLDNAGVLFLAATNLPWSIDNAFMRRFEKRIYVPLPEAAERANMFISKLGNTKNTLQPKDFLTLGNLADNYSGADIAIVVHDAVMEPVRLVQSATHFKYVSGPDPADPSKTVDDLFTPCSPGDSGAIEMSWTDVPGNKLFEPPVTMQDMLQAVGRNKPTASVSDLDKLREFTRNYGQDGV